MYQEHWFEILVFSHLALCTLILGLLCYCEVISQGVMVTWCKFWLTVTGLVILWQYSETLFWLVLLTTSLIAVVIIEDEYAMARLLFFLLGLVIAAVGSSSLQQEQSDRAWREAARPALERRNLGHLVDRATPKNLADALNPCSILDWRERGKASGEECKGKQ
jgi:uncharacterized membrane protein YccC